MSINKRQINCGTALHWKTLTIIKSEQTTNMDSNVDDFFREGAFVIIRKTHIGGLQHASICNLLTWLEVS